MIKKLKNILLNAAIAAVSIIIAVAVVSLLKYMGALYYLNILLLAALMFAVFMYLAWGEDS